MGLYNYMTRVELHGANFQDYENLHSYMKAAGFSTTITGNDGKVYKLPPAEYYYESNTDYTSSQIRDHAKAAANKTGRSNAVITCKTNDVAWNSLSIA